MKLGRVNVDEMLDEIDSQQFLEWKAYAQLAPFTEERMDIRFGTINNTLVNMWRDTKKRKEPWPLDLSIPRFGDMPAAAPPRTQTWQEMKAIGMMMAQASQKAA